MSDIELIKPKLARMEPLRLELEHFVNCIKNKKEPLVSGEHGRNALELAWEILHKLKTYD